MVCPAGISDGCLLTDSNLKPHQGRFNRARQVAPQTPDLDGEFVDGLRHGMGTNKDAEKGILKAVKVEIMEEP